MAVGICPEYFSANRWETVEALIDLECWDKRVRKLVKTNYKNTSSRNFKQIRLLRVNKQREIDDLTRCTTVRHKKKLKELLDKVIKESEDYALPSAKETTHDVSGVSGTSKSWSSAKGTSHDFSYVLGTSKLWSPLKDITRDVNCVSEVVNPWSTTKRTTHDFSYVLGTSNYYRQQNI